MLAFLSWLVKFGVFQAVQISFLPPGHTHKDIDQLFSLYAKHYFCSCCPLPNDFIILIKKVIKNPTPDVHWLNQVYDWKSWFNPLMTNIQGHSTANLL